MVGVIVGVFVVSLWGNSRGNGEFIRYFSQ